MFVVFIGTGLELFGLAWWPMLPFPVNATTLDVSNTLSALSPLLQVLFESESPASVDMSTLRAELFIQLISWTIGIGVGWVGGEDVFVEIEGALLLLLALLAEEPHIAKLLQ